MHDVRLEVQGEAHGGFQRGTVKLSVEQLATSFQLGYTDVWSAERRRVGGLFKIRVLVHEYGVLAAAFEQAG